MRKLIVIFGGLMVFLFCFGSTVPSDASTTLPPGMVIGDSDGMYATSEGEYYIDLMNILPGETYKKEITIRSMDLEEPFSLGLLVNELTSSGSVLWKEHITMALTLDGKEIYQGPILGDGSKDWSKTPLELGVCKYGTDKVLTVVFTIDSNLTNDDLREKSELEFTWTFVGTKDQPNPEPTSPSEESELPKAEQNVTPTTSHSSTKRFPQTGEKIVYKFLSGLLLILIALFLWRKHREEEEE